MLSETLISSFRKGFIPSTTASYFYCWLIVYNSYDDPNGSFYLLELCRLPMFLKIFVLLLIEAWMLLLSLLFMMVSNLWSLILSFLRTRVPRLVFLVNPLLMLELDGIWRFLKLEALFKFRPFLIYANFKDSLL